MKQFITGRIKSIKYAVKGFFLLVGKEDSIKAQAFFGLLITLLGFYVGISPLEWVIQTFCLGFIFTTEGLNTAIEKICDFVHPDYHKEIGAIKDVAAGAVTIAVLTSVIIGGIIYYPYIF